MKTGLAIPMLISIQWPSHFFISSFLHLSYPNIPFLFIAFSLSLSLSFTTPQSINSLKPSLFVVLLLSTFSWLFLSFLSFIHSLCLFISQN